MPDLWANRSAERLAKHLQTREPLAARLRPRTLQDFVGQMHVLGQGKLLRRMLEAKRLTSLILSGPPGTGKTTLAEVIGQALGAHFIAENAANVSVSRIREISQLALHLAADEGKSTILFLDEIHRFSRSQQDVLLRDVERGVLTLIGATTENPLFAVNAALVSRSTLVRLEPLSENDIITILRRAIDEPALGLRQQLASTGHLLSFDDEALQTLATLCDGDARRALSALEVAALSTPPDSQNQIHLTKPVIEQSIQEKLVAYDHTGDQHYDAASALIKSIRGSDPDAAIYWLATMLSAGEDPRFIARRLAILASEDIGNADIRAVVMAEAVWSLTERLGMPECRITLSQLVTYLALAPKSNASYTAINDAMEDVRLKRSVSVPMHIKDRMVRQSHLKAAAPNSDPPSQGYIYTHDLEMQGPLAEIGGISDQDYLDTPRQYYRPASRGTEKALAQRLAQIREYRAALAANRDPSQDSSPSQKSPPPHGSTHP